MHVCVCEAVDQRFGTVVSGSVVGSPATAVARNVVILSLQSHMLKTIVYFCLFHFLSVLKSGFFLHTHSRF